MSDAGEATVVLITGGTGSFGQHYTRFLLQSPDPPQAIRILSRGELLQSQMQAAFQDDARLRFFLGDVRDYRRLCRAMSGVDVVVHAAALKRVPEAEYNPSEACKTNVDGTANVVDAAIDAGVRKCLLISSDKAAHPTTLYGATKAVAEKLFTQANSYSSTTRFATVRYGNVVDSRGSVIPLFREQAREGRLTITDERMTRFWITLDQAAAFVHSSIGIMRGGEIFVPKLRAARIVDIAAHIAPEVPRTIIGIRPGEKLHETLITADESRHTLDIGDRYVIEPEFHFWGYESKVGRRMPPSWECRSDTAERVAAEGLLAPC